MTVIEIGDLRTANGVKSGIIIEAQREELQEIAGKILYREVTVEPIKAMLRLPTHDATRDMLPKSETILRHGLITRQGAEGKGWEEWKEAVEP